MGAFPKYALLSLTIDKKDRFKLDKNSIQDLKIIKKIQYSINWW